MNSAESVRPTTAGTRREGPPDANSQMLVSRVLAMNPAIDEQLGQGSIRSRILAR